MKHVATLLLLGCLPGVVFATESCPVTEHSLIGAWNKSANTGSFEQFELTIDDGKRTFNSRLHERPDISRAAWSLDDCHLVIVPHQSLPPLRLKVLSLEGGWLRLQDGSDRSIAIYRRLPESD